MSKLFSSVEIATLALRRIGNLPTSESAPEGEDLRVTLEIMDLVLAELAGTNRVFSQIGVSLPLTLVAGKTSYLLKDALKTLYPKAGLLNPVSIWVNNAAGRQYEIPIVTRDVWERWRYGNEIGAPEMVYIDREPNPTLFLFPAPRADDPSLWFLEMVYQEQAPNVAPAGVASSVPEAQAHSLRQAWQLWLVKRLAYEIGSGPVETLPGQRLAPLKREADETFARLEARDNEADNLPPIQQAWEPGHFGQGPLVLDYFKRLT